MLTLFSLSRDELLLAGAVTVSMGTVGGVMVPWEGLGFGPNAAEQAMAMYSQLEQANEAYFERHGLWPHEVTQNTPHANAAVLMSRAVLVRPFAQDPTYQPVMEGLLETAADGVVARHTYSKGGTIGMLALNGSDYRYVVMLEGLDVAAAKALDEEIDGSFTPAKGRLRVVENDDGTVTAKYLANARKG